ncbi:MAG: T9SS type A sorting domain-containing protein [Bernardetiaceae bacterium]|nr:T9SS type A sorting domain-containing protein [Bernardetiaceae bacterium]
MQQILFNYKKNNRLLGIIAILLLFAPNLLIAEGTREYMPSATDPTIIQIWDGNANRNSFTYNCPEDRRLQFNVADHTTEVVYFGFGRILDNTNNMNAGNWNNGNNNRLHYRIRRPDGTIFPAHNNVLIPHTGVGFNDTYDTITAGPAQLVGAGGYNALYLDPDMDGDWYIEFNRGNDPNTTPIRKTGIRYFDLTVATGVGSFANNAGTYVAAGTANTGDEITGRLWSKTWDFNCMGQTNPFLGELYVYTNDQIVLSVDFNGMQPWGFTVSCNATGVSNTGDIVVDRRSVAANSTYAEYPVFLNDPDEDVYPSGVIPTLENPQLEIDLCTNYQFKVETTSAGFVEILVDLTNGVPTSCNANYISNGIYDPPSGGTCTSTADRLLGAFVPSAGEHFIPWDGLDGNGDPIPYGTSITAYARIRAGLAHLPLYDVEYHQNGYGVALVRPTGPPPPRLYWDDTNLPAGFGVAAADLLELNGAPPPAHTWPVSGNGFGDNRTINTWFFVTESDSTQIVFLADNSTFEVGGDPLSEVCSGVNDTVTFVVEFSLNKFNFDSLMYAATPNPVGDYILNFVGAVVLDTITDAFGIDKLIISVSYRVLPTEPGETLINLGVDFTVSQLNICDELQSTSVTEGTCEVTLLPVDLLFFRGREVDKGHILLEWRTVWEKGSEGFFVERSTDGIHFQGLGFVPSKGEGQAIRNYNFIDNEPPSGTWYYRLRQVDFDGSEAFSNIIAFQRENTEYLKAVYQDGNMLNVRAQLNSWSPYRIAVYDMLGRSIVPTYQIYGSEAQNGKFQIRLPQVAEGIYLFTIIGAEGKAVKRVRLR